METYGATKGLNEVQKASDLCPSSRYCSPLSCAASFLARYKGDKAYKEFFHSIEGVESELARANFTYPKCSEHCRFIDRPAEAEQVMNDSIQLLKKIHLHGVEIESHEDKAHC